MSRKVFAAAHALAICVKSAWTVPDAASDLEGAAAGEDVGVARGVAVATGVGTAVGLTVVAVGVGAEVAVATCVGFGGGGALVGWVVAGALLAHATRERPTTRAIAATAMIFILIILSIFVPYFYSLAEIVKPQ